MFDFEAVYQAYPRKLGRKKGMDRCKAQVKTPERYTSLLAAATNYATYVAGTDETYIKHFSSFMNEWEDWIEPKKPPASQGSLGLSGSVIPLSTSVNEASRKLRKW